ncbi:MAG: hypothetical protein GY928_26285 [Colwellia sp.]|nr:hypothetical protein [Colwellia sp.]
MTEHIHPEDKHPFDPLIKYFGNTCVVSVFCFLALSIGVFLSIYTSCWTWFGRFGSVVTIAGLLLMNSTLFSEGIYLSHGASGHMQTKHKGDTQIKKTNSQSRKKGTQVFLGIIYAVIGTLIWGFGDLIST